MDQNLSSHGCDMALLCAVQVPHWTCFRIIKLHKGKGVPASPPPHSFDYLSGYTQTDHRKNPLGRGSRERLKEDFWLIEVLCV